MEEIKSLLVKIDSQLHKNLWFIIAIITFCFIICLCAVFFYKPTLRFDTSEIKAKEKERVMIEKQNEALKELIHEQAKSISFFTKRDSSIQSEIKLNRIAIEKIKIPDEKITLIQHYSSADLQSYFANLPDPR